MAEHAAALSRFLGHLGTANEGFWAAQAHRTALRSAAALLKPNGGFQKHLVLRTEKEYGAVLVASTDGQDEKDTAEYHVLVLGLDGWRFSSGAGRVAAIAHSEPSIIHVGILAREQRTTFEDRYGSALAVMRSRTKDQRSASNAHGGHQKTPSCIAALAEWVIKHVHLSKTEFQEVCNPQKMILKPRGGFSDVGRHTGSEPRDTEEALALSLLHFSLFAADPALDMPSLIFERAVGEYRLHQASDALKELEALASIAKLLQPNIVDAVVLPLADATRRIARIAEICHDSVTNLMDECELRRVRLDAAIATNGRLISESYVLIAPAASAMVAQQSPQPTPPKVTPNAPSGK
jgi:hypothetical protein